MIMIVIEAVILKGIAVNALVFCVLLIITLETVFFPNGGYFSYVKSIGL